MRGGPRRNGCRILRRRERRGYQQKFPRASDSIVRAPLGYNSPRFTLIQDKEQQIPRRHHSSGCEGDGRWRPGRSAFF